MQHQGSLRLESVSKVSNASTRRPVLGGFDWEAVAIALRSQPQEHRLVGQSALEVLDARYGCHTTPREPRSGSRPGLEWALNHAGAEAARGRSGNILPRTWMRNELAWKLAVGTRDGCQAPEANRSTPKHPMAQHALRLGTDGADAFDLGTTTAKGSPDAEPPRWIRFRFSLPLRPRGVHVVRGVVRGES